MRTAYSPESYTELGSGRAEAGPYMPGSHYRDVDVVISTRRDSYRVHIVESWGSVQGDDEEHGRLEVIGNGQSLNIAIGEARRKGQEAEVDIRLLTQALSSAEDQAIQEEEEAAEDEKEDARTYTDGRLNGLRQAHAIVECFGSARDAGQAIDKAIDSIIAAEATKGVVTS